MAVQYFLPRPVHLDDLGAPVVNGRLQFFDVGTSNPKEVFSDPDLLITAGAVVSLDAAGRLPDATPQLWYGYGEYTVVLQSFETGVWTNVWQAPYVVGAVDPGAANVPTQVTCNTIADLKAVDTDIFTRAVVLGAASVSTGGGGTYRWSPLLTTTDDGGWYIERTLGGQGRWVRILEAGADKLDIRIWQAQTSTGPIDSQYNAAFAIAASFGLPVYFPVGTWVFQDDTTVSARVIIDDGAKFDCVDYAASRTISFTSSQTTIKSISPLTVRPEVHVLFSNTDGVDAIDYRWGYTPAESVAIASTSGLPLAFLANTSLASNVGSLTVPVIVGPDAVLTCGTYKLTAESVQVLGRRRKAISTALATAPQLGTGVPVDAWWFGYGVDSSTNDHGTLLDLADQIALSSGNQLIISRRSVAKSVLSAITVSSPCILEGPVNIGLNGSVTINSLFTEPTGKIFIFEDATARATVVSSPINPLWYGMSPASSDSVNQNAWEDMITRIGITAIIDGRNLAYDVEGFLPLPTALKLTNIILTGSNGLPVIYDQDMFYLDMANVELYNNSGPSLEVQIPVGNTAGLIRIRDCVLNAESEIRAYGPTGFVEINNSRMNKSCVIFTTSQSQVQVTSNSFNGGMLRVGSDTSASLGNITIVGNKFRGNDQDEIDVQIFTNQLNTVVTNVNITGNTFYWYGSPSSLVLINPVKQESGTFITWQSVKVRNNTCVGTYTLGTETTAGPWCSSTSGTSAYQLPAVVVTGSGTYNATTYATVGPFFLPVGYTNTAASAWYTNDAECLISGTIGFAASGNVVVTAQYFNATMETAIGFDTTGRFRRVRKYANFVYGRTDGAAGLVAQRHILNWGHRCDLGESSNSTAPF
jgi:hypothetical protein